MNVQKRYANLGPGHVHMGHMGHMPTKGGGGHLPDNYAISVISALVIDPLL